MGSPCAVDELAQHAARKLFTAVADIGCHCQLLAVQFAVVLADFVAEIAGGAPALAVVLTVFAEAVDTAVLAMNAPVWNPAIPARV